MTNVLSLFGEEQSQRAFCTAQIVASGCKAIEAMVRNIESKIIDRDFDLQELSSLLQEEGRKITGTILKEILQEKFREHAECETTLCLKCGIQLRSRGAVKRKIETMHGPIVVDRNYFYCRGCKFGFYPFDVVAGIAKGLKQYDLQRAIAELFIEVPHKRASEIFNKITGLSVNDHWSHRVGEGLGKIAEEKNILPGKERVAQVISSFSQGKVWRPVLVISADGAHLPVRPEAKSRSGKRGPGFWKEAKGFRMYLVGRDRIAQVLSWHQIATEDEFGVALRIASKLIPKSKVRIGLVADGAAWIWNHFKDVFPKGKEILDYYHCSEHIHKVAKIQYHEDEEQQKLWIESAMARLNFGEVDSVIWGLQRMQANNKDVQDEIDKLIVYLKNNRHRINYKTVKKGGYPRGSGGIESANKFICHVRMKRSGAWWYVVNGNQMLKLRCAKNNGTFDELFAAHKRSLDL